MAFHSVAGENRRKKHDRAFVAAAIACSIMERSFFSSRNGIKKSSPGNEEEKS